jgi:copper chaperone CopZ
MVRSLLLLISVSTRQANSVTAREGLRPGRRTERESHACHYHQTKTRRRELAEFTLKIDGMHCGSCVRRVSQALAATPGVTVNEIRIGAVRLSSDEEPPPLGLAIAAIAKAGYTAYLESGTVDAASS